MFTSPRFPGPPRAATRDFRVWNGTDRIIGYIEAKKPTEERLDIIEDSEHAPTLPLDVS